MGTARLLGPPSRLRQARRAAGDALFLLTTRQLGPERIEDADLFDPADALEAAGWRLRTAGPRWFVVWHGGTARLSRLRAILLPEPWIGLIGPETAAIFHAQLAALGISGLVPHGRGRDGLDPSSPQIWTKLARANRSG